MEVHINKLKTISYVYATNVCFHATPPPPLLHKSTECHTDPTIVTIIILYADVRFELFTSSFSKQKLVFEFDDLSNNLNSFDPVHQHQIQSDYNIPITISDFAAVLQAQLELEVECRHVGILNFYCNESSSIAESDSQLSSCSTICDAGSGFSSAFIIQQVIFILRHFL